MGSQPLAEPSLLNLEELRNWRRGQRDLKNRIVVTNGCFDVLHAGHVDYLERARRLGDYLVVGLNRDTSVRALKGPGRPVYCEADRAKVLLALRSVSFVTLFEEMDALSFLKIAEPDIYVKGGDYTPESLNQSEFAYLTQLGARIEILPELKGLSSSGAIEKLSESDPRADYSETSD